MFLEFKQLNDGKGESLLLEEENEKTFKRLTVLRGIKIKETCGYRSDHCTRSINLFWKQRAAPSTPRYSDISRCDHLFIVITKV